MQPFEQVKRYAAKRIRDRFDRAMLVGYLEALGIEPDDPSFWGQALRIEDQSSWRTRETTIEDIQREYGIRHG